MALFSPPKSSLGGKHPVSQARMVGGVGFLNPQGPETSKKRKYGVPAQGQGVMHEYVCPAMPNAYGQHRPAQNGKWRLRRIQTPEPSTQGGGIGHAIGIFDRGRGGFPATALHEIAPERLATRDQAVVAIRWRERGQEGERLPTQIAEASANRNPIVIFVVRLFPATPMADDRIAQTNRTLTQDRSWTRFGPIGFEVALRCGKWDKEDRVKRASPWRVILAESLAGAEPFPPCKYFDWKEYQNLHASEMITAWPSQPWPVN